MMTNTRQRIILLSITILLNLISSIATTTTQWWTKQTTTHSKTIIAYYASWQWYDRDGLAAPKNLDHSKVTRYNFAFFQVYVHYIILRLCNPHVLTHLLSSLFIFVNHDVAHLPDKYSGRYMGY